MKSRKLSWTPEENERLRAHVASGGSAARAAVMFKRTQPAVRSHATELGLRFPSIRELRVRMGGGDPRTAI